MTFTWINRGTQDVKTPFIGLSAYRTPVGFVRLCIYVGTAAQDALDIRAGERYLIGLDAKSQRLALIKTFEGGTLMSPKSNGRPELQTQPTLRLINVPRRQLIVAEDIAREDGMIVMPFSFDPAEFAVPATARFTRAARSAVQLVGAEP